MKNASLFLILVLSHLAINVYAQGDWKFKYTNRTVVVKYPGDIRLVAGISGHHHLVVISPAKKPVIYIYNDQLEMITNKELPLQHSNAAGIQILSFKSFYYIYVHLPKSKRYELWKVSGGGNFTNLSDSLNGLLQAAFKEEYESLQLVNKNNELNIIAQTYYSSIKKMVTTILRTDSLLNPLHIRNVAFSFNKKTDFLQQIMLPADNSMIILKKKFNPEQGSMLELIKTDMTTGTAITTSYSSRNLKYWDTGLFYNASDSTIVLYSLLKENANEPRRYRSFMISRLDLSLNELAPVALIKPKPYDNTTSHFVLLQDQMPKWISLFGNRSAKYSRTVLPGDTLITEGISAPDNFSTISPEIKGIPVRSYDDRFNRYNGIRFILLDKELKIQKDSLVTNEKSRYYIQPDEASRFRINDKSCLLLLQHFSKKRKGLLLLYSKDGKHFIAEDVRVHDQYDYILSHLEQTASGTIVLPYISRSEVGLVKIMMDQ